MKMIDRHFRLPGIEELNKDQDRVLRLPKEGQFLVVGAPGTGKSVVALLRMMKYKAGGDYVFLVYNKVLAAATRQLVKGGFNSNSWKQWFYRIVHKKTNSDVPQSCEYTPDYKKIIGLLEELNLDQVELKLIIDEGQDMPPEFYESLMCLGMSNFFVTADQNQQLTDEHSSTKEIRNKLALEISDVIELKENFRNAFSIARLAQHFYTDPSSPKPDLPPETKNSLKVPILYEYDQRKFEDKLIPSILKKSDRDPRWLIGIFCSNNKVREKYYKALMKARVKLDNEKPVISTYGSNDQSVNINFSKGGIVVLNSKSVKGLEFDIVFIADLDQFFIYGNDIDRMKKELYVMVSRAIKQVVILKPIGRMCKIESLLPDDESILKRIGEHYE
jgi:DNA helicase IV